MTYRGKIHLIRTDTIRYTHFHHFISYTPCVGLCGTVFANVTFNLIWLVESWTMTWTKDSRQHRQKDKPIRENWWRRNLLSCLVGSPSLTPALWNYIFKKKFQHCLLCEPHNPTNKKTTQNENHPPQNGYLLFDSQINVRNWGFLKDFIWI